MTSEGTSAIQRFDRGGGALPLEDIRAGEALNRLKGRGSFAEILERTISEGGTTEREPTRPADAKLREACYEMESIFVGYMLKAMRRTLDETDFLGKTVAKDIFRDMLYDEYAKIMARTDQLGIAREIYTQLRGQKAL